MIPSSSEEDDLTFSFFFLRLASLLLDRFAFLCLLGDFDRLCLPLRFGRGGDGDGDGVGVTERVGDLSMALPCPEPPSLGS